MNRVGFIDPLHEGSHMPCVAVGCLSQRVLRLWGFGLVSGALEEGPGKQGSALDWTELEAGEFCDWVRRME